MKIILIVLSVILAGVIGTGGYFIYSLTGQINDLETELGLKLAQSVDELNSTLSETAGRLDQVDTTLGDALALSNDAIEEANASLAEYTTEAGGRFTEIENNIMGASYKITNLQTIAEDTQNILDSSVLQSRELYDKVHEAIVMISDGTHLLGSGFLVSFPGGANYVVTAYHVVKGAPIVDGFPKLYVTLFDGTTWQAFFAARSEDADIAIISASTRPEWPLDSWPDFPSVELSNSVDVEVGEAVFVVGSPGDDEDSRLGLSETMTTGVISQINRGATIDGQYIPNLLQFDAAANFGNSGSPLFNSDGEVIGVVIARFNPLFGDGISFAVKSSQIMKVWSKFTLGEDGGFHLTAEAFSPMYKYPWTGLTVRDTTPLEMLTITHTLTAGAKVTNVTGPASVAGLVVNDIITKIDDREVNNSDEFYSFIAEYYSPGDTITLEITRGEEELSIMLELQEKP